MSLHRCRVRFVRHGCGHTVCFPVPREVPPTLRCSSSGPAGYGAVGAAGCGCSIPWDAVVLVLRALRDQFEESSRRGHVLIDVG